MIEHIMRLNDNIGMKEDASGDGIMPPVTLRSTASDVKER